MKTSQLFLLIGACFVSSVTSLPALSPLELRQKLAAGEKLTLIDVRSTSLFKQRHIPDAINLPASVVFQKQLPPLGPAVVYDSGLTPDTAQAAVAALNQKPGISAQVLEGGLAGWEAAQGATTQARGLHQEQLPFITYAALKQLTAQEVLLVDLRAGPSGAAALVQTTTAPPRLTNLQTEFPGFRVVGSASEATALFRSGATAAAPSPLLVLIDRGDGTAQTVARNLRAGGVSRFVILAGGELILARHGEPGLQRSGLGVAAPNQLTNTSSSTH